jgi:uncharacterized protein with PIN domain
MNHCFAVDRSLGKLARWLRLLGYDTTYESDVSTRWFWKHLEDNRVVITRTVKIQKTYTARKMVFIESDHLGNQLKQVINDIGIRPADIRPFSRCIDCNLPVVDINKEDVYNRVPGYVWQIHDKFRTCPGCQRVYWPGSHIRRSAEKIERLFES